MATYELVQLEWIATAPAWLECERPLFYSTVDVQTTGATPIYAADLIVNAESRHSSRVLVVEPNVVRKWVSRTPPAPYDHICGADGLLSEWSKRDGTDVETTAIAMLAEDGADLGHCLAALSFVFHASAWAQLIQITHCEMSYVARVLYSPTGGPVRMRIASGVTFADMDVESLRVETSLFHREVHARALHQSVLLRRGFRDLAPAAAGRSHA